MAPWIRLDRRIADFSKKLHQLLITQLRKIPGSSGMQAVINHSVSRSLWYVGFVIDAAFFCYCQTFSPSSRFFSPLLCATEVLAAYCIVTIGSYWRKCVVYVCVCVCVQPVTTTSMWLSFFSKTEPMWMPRIREDSYRFTMPRHTGSVEFLLYLTYVSPWTCHPVHFLSQYISWWFIQQQLVVWIGAQNAEIVLIAHRQAYALGLLQASVRVGWGYQGKRQGPAQWRLQAEVLQTCFCWLLVTRWATMIFRRVISPVLKPVDVPSLLRTVLLHLQPSWIGNAKAIVKTQNCFPVIAHSVWPGKPYAFGILLEVPFRLTEMFKCAGAVLYGTQNSSVQPGARSRPSFL